MGLGHPSMAITSQQWKVYGQMQCGFNQKGHRVLHRWLKNLHNSLYKKNHSPIITKYGFMSPKDGHYLLARWEETFI
jgi:hypothetical protein